VRGGDANPWLQPRAFALLARVPGLLRLQLWVPFLNTIPFIELVLGWRCGCRPDGGFPEQLRADIVRGLPLITERSVTHRCAFAVAPKAPSR
jgi:hypothetical protein